MSQSSRFWIEDPKQLIDFRNVGALLNSAQSATQRFNALSQIIVLLSMVTALARESVTPLIMGLLCLGVIAWVYKSGYAWVEGNQSRLLPKKTAAATMPTPLNPIMNVMPSNYRDCPNRPPAALSYKPSVAKKMRADTQNSLGARGIDPRLFKEIGGGGSAREEDLYFDQSMHQFYPTPSTQIPNGQTAFAKWCYGGMISAKEGNKKALLEGAPPNWVNG